MKYPLRAAQRNILSAQNIHEDHRLAHIGALAHIVGVLDADLFWRAADFVAQHSAAVRSSLHDGDDGQHQIAHDDTGFAREMLDLRAHADPQAAAQRFVDDDFANRPFATDGREIACGMVLIQVGDNDHIAYAKFHHALFDGWGTSLFYARLCDAYNRMRAGEAPQPWDETSVDAMLADERAYLASDKCDASRRYWAERLASYDSEYFSRATSQSNRRTVLALSAADTAALHAWSDAQRASPFHFFAAVLQATLFRVVGARDLAIGLPILNRRTAMDKQTIGLFLGFCVLRTSATPADTFAALVARIGTQLKADFRHQRYPLDAVSGDQGRLPFEVSLSYERHDYDAKFDGTQTTVTPLRTPAQSYPLRVYVRDFSARRPIYVDFDTNDSCFGELAPQTLVDAFRDVLREALDDANARLVPAKLADRDARATCSTALPVPSHANLCDAFEQIATQYPDAIAVSGDVGSLTYAELDARANALAWTLRDLGAGPELRIGLASGRDIHFAIGMLAILKTGAAYVPLDSAYPDERLRFLIDDSAMIAIVGTDVELERLPRDKHLPRCVISLDDNGGNRTAPPRAVCAAQAAYVIYTSGSTGTPKGCIVTHANVLRLFDVTRESFSLAEHDVWSVFHSTAFDFSVWELWGALLHGAQAVFVPFETSRDPLAFADFLRTHRVSVLSQTPSAFRLLDRQPGTLPALRLVVFGGEALEPAALRDWFDRYGDTRPRLVNMYGITETTVHVTARTLRRADADTPLSPIGEPLADLSLQLLDRHGEPVLDGVAGEIHVGGAGVARGYLNRPGLTAARFVPDPDGAPGARRYRAGDLARRRADGEIVYLGRADQQIKIRGFRIEPGEIEVALRDHPGVRDAAVVADDDAHGNARLVAYATPSSDALDPVALRAHLAARLPAHMIPAHVVVLDALPLTVNGKLDRRALPRPEAVVDDTHREPPATPTERLLADIWARVLGREPARYDSFFALGGDSINSLEVVTEARARGVYVSPLQLRECPTLAALAEAVDRDPLPPVAASAAPAPFALLSDADRARLPDGLEDALPMSRLQLGMLFHRERDGGAVFHDVFRYRLRIPAWDEAAWHCALAAVTRAHATLRTGFALDGFSTPLQLIRREAAASLQVFDCRTLDDAAQRVALDAFVDAEQRRDFDIAHGPMLRLFIHRVADDAIHVTLSFHHAIVDGWSVATLMTELIGHACGGPRIEAASDAPVLALHAAAERDALADDALRRAWRERLARQPATLLAGDADAGGDPHDPSRITSRRTVERVVLRVSQPLSTSLAAQARALGVELRSQLLTAHLRALSMLTGSDCPVTGYVVHNRPDHALSARATGLFLNSVPLGARLAPGSWAGLIRQVAAAEREIDSLKRLPLAAIADEAGAGRLFDVAFNYIHFHVYRDALDLPGVAVVDFDAHEETDFPLLVQFARDPAGDGFDVSLHYDVARFGAAQIERHVAVLDAALRDIAADVDAPWLSMAVVGVRDWPVTSRPPIASTLRHANLCDAFEQIATQYPDAIAVSGDAGSLTYAELDARANALAWTLRDLGAGPELRIGLASARDIHFAIGMLAILKTGAAYVPLDSAYPDERLRFLIDDSAMIAIVGTDAELERLPRDKHLPRCVISLDDDDGNRRAPPRSVCAAQAAYVIYTSGSTGTPKGCIVTHANVLRLFDVTRESFSLAEHDVWSVFHSTAFDFSVWELWGALLHGAQAVFVPFETSRDPLAFVDFLRTHRVSVLSQTPSAFRLLDRQPGTLPALRLVVFGGEALEPAALRDWFDRYGDTRPRLVNMYGITETTVHVTARTLHRADADTPLSPIGEPLADLSLQLLDRHGEPVLDGVAGEIHVGGAGVARGYLNRPGLTAARFVPDPNGAPGARRYRAGDLARRRADGEIVYLGRADQQIKIRGFRIEPGEIEAALRDHPGVRDAAVVADDDAHGNARLVAYATPASDALDPVALRGHLAARLPAHMIPAHVVVLDALPLTVNGKLDRRALPRPEAVVDDAHREPPATPTERMLADIWARVLGREPARHDSFFALGGDSIASLKALNAARVATGLDLPLQGMFMQPTLHALAAWIDALAADAREAGASTPTPVRRAARVRARISAGPDGSHLTTLDKAL
ncbi:non-ribosomal peptide synthetase [Burkholderia sp. BE17]|uniref:non-ribosomal peptide synthetase n=1 Tax=Burkholderia sp. BE17 TaxID=2656644 RepID=UPI00128E5382|nr:non-ribosomal peptide synthetase [Burkholderia sp. BE17]MPV70489.1 amino acid adenylation domain-containing protein [Burkholderia sp. BE17]